MLAGGATQHNLTGFKNIQVLWTGSQKGIKPTAHGQTTNKLQLKVFAIKFVCVCVFIHIVVFQTELFLPSVLV